MANKKASIYTLYSVNFHIDRVSRAVAWWKKQIKDTNVWFYVKDTFKNKAAFWQGKGVGIIIIDNNNNNGANIQNRLE